mmetsp:Transcript_53968/g.101216  ORF Transcript_53968/g.101216 Transcript_53968/m.101216 type:complete len:617 (+) Transcript_53968:45-1895(+)
MNWLALCWLLVNQADATSCYDGAGGFLQEHWPFCQQLKPGLLMYFGPSMDGDYMKLGLHAENHTGWSALAIGGNGGMKGAQQFVVRKVDDEWVAEERYSTDYTTPQLQETQEVLLFFASESGGHTSWGVLLPTRSCQPGDRYAMEDVGMFMHWALGYSHDFFHHKERGQFSTNLVAGPPTPPPDMSSFETVTMTMPDVSVVMGEGGSDPKNPYICGVFDLGAAMRSGLNHSLKHHVAKFSPVLDPASVQYVHHMILFECSDEAASQNNFTHNQIVPNCERMIRGCQTTTWPWAVGGGDLVLPDDVGVPVGNGARWYALQVHYYNPSLEEGVNDGSGVRLTLSPAIRTHDAATFGVNGGVAPMQRDPLPAGEADYALPSAVLPSGCTNQWDVEEITVLGVMHHAHLLGKKLALHVTRNGEYLGEMRREKYYDFNHQSLEGSSVAKLRRGDELTLTCSYDTTSRTEPTTFGDLTQDEMCLAYFLHYPAQKVRRSIFLRAQGDSRVTICPDPDNMPASMPDTASFQPTDSFELSNLDPSALLSFATISTAPVLNPPTCQARGVLKSSASLDVLRNMSVNVSSFTITTTTPTEAPNADASATFRASAFVVLLLPGANAWF